MNRERHESDMDQEQLADEDRTKPAAPAGDVPAGGGGADSGAVSAVRVDPEDEAQIPNRSSMNDEPGVGTRGPDDDMDSSDE